MNNSELMKVLIRRVRIFNAVIVVILLGAAVWNFTIGRDGDGLACIVVAVLCGTITAICGGGD